MNEEVQVRFGADTSGIDRAMRSLSHQVKEFGENLKDKFKEVFSEFAGPLIGIGIVAAFEKVLEKVKGIKRAAESLGVSTGFYQDLLNVAKASGIGAESIEKMMGKFIQGLKPGQDVEEMFYNLADNIAAIPDPTERARMAFDAFGKQGVKMIAILRGGSEELKNLAKQFDKFGDLEIASIESANQQLEHAQNMVTIIAGKVLAALDRLAEGVALKIVGGGSAAEIGQFLAKADTGMLSANEKRDREERQLSILNAQRKAYKEEVAAIQATKDKIEEMQYKQMSGEEKITFLKKKQAEAATLVNAADDPVEEEKLKQKILGYEERINDIKKEQAKAEEKITRELEKRDRALAKSERKLERERSDFTKWSLGDLADLAKPSGWYSGIGGSFQTFSGPPLARLAKRAQSELSSAHMAEAWGNPDVAAMHRNNYEELVKANPALKSGEQNPFQAAQEEISENIRKLANAATGDGIKIMVEDE